MALCLIQNRFFLKKSILPQDHFLYKNKIKIDQTQFKILDNRVEGSKRKYYLAKRDYDTLVYIILSIFSIKNKLFSINKQFCIQIQISLDCLPQKYQQLLSSFNSWQLNNFLSQISFYIGYSVQCIFNNTSTHSKKLRIKTFTRFIEKGVLQTFLNFSFKVMEWLFHRLQVYSKVINNHQNTIFKQISYLRQYFSYVSLGIANDSTQYTRCQKQKNNAKQYMKLIVLDQAQNLLQNQNQFVSNVNKKQQLAHQLQQLKTDLQYPKQRLKYKKSLNKICTNILIHKTPQKLDFQKKSQYSVVTTKKVIFKPLSTHHDKRRGYEDNQQNKRFMDKIHKQATWKQNKLICKEVIPQDDCQNQNQFQSAKKSFQNQQTFLELMRDAVSENIASYYLNRALKNQIIEKRVIYCQFYKTSLGNWIFNTNIKGKSNISLDIGIQILNALYFLKQYGIIHRDMKPDNIMLDQNQMKELKLKLIDFGSVTYFCDKNGFNMFEAFNNKLRTSQQYNIYFLQILRNPSYSLAAANIRNKYNNKTYNRHQKFDMYAFGKILEKMNTKINHMQQLKHNLQYLKSRCSQIDPQNRLDHLQAMIFLKRLQKIYFKQ